MDKTERKKIKIPWADAHELSCCEKESLESISKSFSFFTKIKIPSAGLFGREILMKEFHANQQPVGFCLSPKNGEPFLARAKNEASFFGVRKKAAQKPAKMPATNYSRPLYHCSIQTAQRMRCFWISPSLFYSQFWGAFYEKAQLKKAWD